MLADGIEQNVGLYHGNGRGEPDQNGRAQASSFPVGLAVSTHRHARTEGQCQSQGDVRPLRVQGHVHQAFSRLAG